MKKITFILLLILLSTAVWGRRNPFPDKVDYVNVIGKDCSAYFHAAAPDFFLRQAADNLNYPLFRWTSDKHTDARYPGYSNSPELNFFGVKVVEMIVRFEDDRLHQLYTVFYSRGDAKTLLRMTEFNKLRSTLEKKLADYTGDNGKQVVGNLTENDRLVNRIYIQNGFVFELKSSIRTERNTKSGEFIQLEISRFDPEHDPRRQRVSHSHTSVRRVELAKNLKRPGNGDVWLDNIPMVDQGMKGYCVPAVLERILRYYGNEDVTQHTLAQVAGSRADKGTSVESMVEVVQQIGGKFGVKVSPVYLRGNGVKDLEKVVRDYNKIARQMKKRQISIVVQKKGNTTYYMVAETLAKMQPEVELEFWTSRKMEYKEFQNMIRKNIDKGIPVIWSVQLGKFKEEKIPSQTAGGHMRLIIGYNEKNNTVIYTDTWGSGHEKKSMPANQAWAITTAYFTVTPR